jgi:hypothetical protein
MTSRRRTLSREAACDMPVAHSMRLPRSAQRALLKRTVLPTLRARDLDTGRRLQRVYEGADQLTQRTPRIFPVHRTLSAAQPRSGRDTHAARSPQPLAGRGEDALRGWSYASTHNATQHHGTGPHLITTSEGHDGAGSVPDSVVDAAAAIRSQRDATRWHALGTLDCGKRGTRGDCPEPTAQSPRALSLRTRKVPHRNWGPINHNCPAVAVIVRFAFPTAAK